MANHWSDRRVVVTGLGVVSSLGNDIETFWNNIVNGRCGIDLITSFDTTAYDCKIAAEVRNFDPTPALPSPKEARRSDRFAQFGLSLFEVDIHKAPEKHPTQPDGQPDHEQYLGYVFFH